MGDGGVFTQGTTALHDQKWPLTPYDKNCIHVLGENYLDFVWGYI